MHARVSVIVNVKYGFRVGLQSEAKEALSEVLREGDSPNGPDLIRRDK